MMRNRDVTVVLTTPWWVSTFVKSIMFQKIVPKVAVFSSYLGCIFVYFMIRLLLPA